MRALPDASPPLQKRKSFVGTWFADLRSRSLAARSSLLGLVVVAVYALVAPLAGAWGGRAALAAAAAAAGFCLAGAALALIVSHLLRGPKYALYGLLLGMALRMGIPLGLALACHALGGTLAEAGLFHYLLVFYPITLGVETALSLPSTRQSRQSSQVP
jgi:hypothetical protein